MEGKKIRRKLGMSGSQRSISYASPQFFCHTFFAVSELFIFRQHRPQLKLVAKLILLLREPTL